MNWLIRFSGGVAMCGALVGPAVAATPPASFAACSACHSTDGKHGIGPSLQGIAGRKAGGAQGFTYSKAMRRAGDAGTAWNQKSLEDFVADPQKAMPGNVMPFAGVPDPKQRAEIVTYLLTL